MGFLGLFKPNVGKLVAALKGKDEDTRREVAWILGEIGDSRAIKSLEELARNDPHPIVQPGCRRGAGKD